MVISSVFNIIPQLRTERTPGMAAVSGYKAKALPSARSEKSPRVARLSDEVTGRAFSVLTPGQPGAQGAAPPDFAFIPGQIPGAQGAAPPYLDHIANVVQPTLTVASKKNNGLPAKCPGYFVIGECLNGHRFAKEIYCGREWCPVCGEDESPAHTRRFARWVTKAQQLQTMGYLVFTIPEEVRGRYRSKARLNELTKRVTAGDKSRHIEGLLKSMGFDRGLARWHWFGETPGKWHPHLNVVIEAGHLSKPMLLSIRRAWAGILGVDVAVVNYSFTNVVPKMVHILKYVTRATFRDYSWDERMAGSLYNFRNMRSWGSWSGPAAWEMEGEAELEPIAKLESGLCPECGEPVSWGRARDIAWLEMWVETGQAESMGAGYWVILKI
jgi:rRNA maturation protein Nop10